MRDHVADVGGLLRDGFVDVDEAVVILDAGELGVAVRAMSGHDLTEVPAPTLKRALRLVEAGRRSAEALERRLQHEVNRRRP